METLEDHGTAAAAVPPELVALLVRAAAATDDWAASLTLSSRLDGDLLLDECELALLAHLLLERFGPTADLVALRAGLDLDRLEALTVGDLQRELLPGPPEVHG